jgi:hypothetical protein
MLMRKIQADMVLLSSVGREILADKMGHAQELTISPCLTLKHGKQTPKALCHNGIAPDLRPRFSFQGGFELTCAPIACHESPRELIRDTIRRVTRERLGIAILSKSRLHVNNLTRSATS